MFLFTVRVKLYLLRNYILAQHSNRVHFCDTRGAAYVPKLCELLGCTRENSEFLIRKNKKLLTLDSVSIQKVALLCKDNLKLCDVLQHPTVLSLSPGILNDRLLTLNELGCTGITAGNILRFDQFMKKTPSQLRWKGYSLIPGTSCTQAMSQLDCPQDLKLHLTSKLVDLQSCNSVLSSIKDAINTIYLAWKLQCSEEAVAGILSKYPSLRTKSLCTFERTFKIFLEKLDLPLSKVCSSPVLLTLDCDNIEELLRMVPKICGVSIQSILKKQPLILKRSAKSVYNSACVLESHGVTDAQLLSCPKILNFSASTISSRLCRLASSENSATLKSSKRFLWLIFYFNNITKSKTIIEGLKIRCTLDVHVRMFGTDVIMKYIEQRSQARNKHKGNRNLATSAVLKAMKKELVHHPNVNLASVQNARKVIEYLLNKGITKEQLQNGLEIILYDVAVVSQYFSNLSNRDDLYYPFSVWIKHPNVIQLLVYVIEKDQSIKRNGVNMRALEHQAQNDEDDELQLAEALAVDDEICEHL